MDELTNKKVLVTGAAGFIGGALCRRLSLNTSISIIGVDNLRSGNWSRTPSNVEKIERDISDISLEEWLQLLDGVDYVFHLAAEKYNSSKSTPEKLLNANVAATERLFRASAMQKVRRTVFTSSLYAYGSLGPNTMHEDDRPEPITLYGASKLMGEGMLRSLDRELGLSWNVARLFFIFGPQQFAEGGYKSVIVVNFERMLRGEAPVVNGSGEQSLDYVYVEDCVDALLTLATSENDRQVVNVSSANAITVNELTKLMCAVANSSAVPAKAPADWTEGSRRCGDNQRIGSVFGWRPATPVENGLRSTFNWMQSEVAAQ